MKLPEAIGRACEPLFAALPMDQAMCSLKGSRPAHTDLVERTLQDPAIRGRGDIAAALWLYVDDLDRSHTVSQSQSDATDRSGMASCTGARVTTATATIGCGGPPNIR